jgi:predicted alpha/beta superfamily hydrolase
MRTVVLPGQFHVWGPLEVPGFAARTVRIYVPSDHPRDGTRPALYLFDGQNVFGDEGSFSGGWHADHAVDTLARRGRNIPVVVGIDHGGPDRISEMAPWGDGSWKGRADEFLDWVAGGLVPRVREAFALRGGPVGAVVGGSSMGGLAALYAHFRHPDAFGGALVMSPSLWVARRSIFDYVQRRPTPAISRVYLDCGGREGGGRMLRLAEQMAAQLASRGYPGGQLMWRPDRRGGHNEKAWRRRLPKALRFMFRA